MNNIDRLKYSGYLMGELMIWLKKIDDSYLESDLIIEAHRFLKDLEDYYDCDFKIPKEAKKKPIKIDITDEELEELRMGKIFEWHFDRDVIIENKNYHYK
jgi:hypothetical protein